MKKIIALFAVALLPTFAFAQGFASLNESLNTLTRLINQLIPFAIGIGVLIFIFGLIKYVTAGADEDGRKGARDTIIWGIVVIFVMTAVWGLVNVIDNTLMLDNTVPTDIPVVPSRGGNN